MALRACADALFHVCATPPPFPIVRHVHSAARKQALSATSVPLDTYLHSPPLHAAAVSLVYTFLIHLYFSLFASFDCLSLPQMGKSALKPAPTSTTHSATNTAVNTTHTQNGTSTPKKRVDKVVTARPVTTETKPSPKIDLNPSKSVTETIKAIDEQIAKENGANESNIAATHSEQPQPSEQTVQLKQTPKAPVQVDDKRQVTIEWTPHMGSTVFITGSFCDWKQKHPVSTEGGSYKVTLPLPPGKHVFKFVVDGEWFYDITQPTETDAEGNVNNVITV